VQNVKRSLSSPSTTGSVEKALAARPIPGFRVGELVSLWEPEIADKAIQHVMPKKLQYKWNGPFAIEERENDHYYIHRKGKRILANPGRLRKYYTWTNDPWENEEDQDKPPGKDIDSGEIEVGDMIVVSLKTTAKMSRPFAVGKVTAIREHGIYLIHWHGNVLRKLEGTYRPEWVIATEDGSRVNIMLKNSTVK
jgi:hypothetical protein